MITRLLHCLGTPSVYGASTLDVQDKEKVENQAELLLTVNYTSLVAFNILQNSPYT